MQLNITTDYALWVLLYLLRTDGNADFSRIAKEMAIPRSYLIKVQICLKQGGINNLGRKPEGEYYLDVPLSETAEACQFK